MAMRGGARYGMGGGGGGIMHGAGAHCSDVGNAFSNAIANDKHILLRFCKLKHPCHYDCKQYWITRYIALS